MWQNESGRKLPSSCLVDALSNEVSRESILELPLVLEGVVHLGIGHAATFEPAVEHLGHTVQGALPTAGRDAQLVNTAGTNTQQPQTKPTVSTASWHAATLGWQEFCLSFEWLFKSVLQSVSFHNLCNFCISSVQQVFFNRKKRKFICVNQNSVKTFLFTLNLFGKKNPKVFLCLLIYF